MEICKGKEVCVMNKHNYGHWHETHFTELQLNSLPLLSFITDYQSGCKSLITAGWKHITIICEGLQAFTCWQLTMTTLYQYCDLLATLVFISFSTFLFGLSLISLPTFFVCIFGMVPPIIYYYLWTKVFLNVFP